MSGIAGVWMRGGRRASSDALQAMATALRHRGPDATGSYAEGPVGLASVLLRTGTPSLSEEQPARSPDGETVLVADVRLDNRDDLLGRLGPGTSAGGEWSDAELLLAAYGRFGADLCDHLEGDFALALHDRSRRLLLCARDALGVRPLAYHEGADLFAFASEIKALLCLPEVPRRLDEARVATYLEGVPEGEETFYRGIRWLAPGASLVVADGRGREGPRVRLGDGEAAPPRDVPGWVEAFDEGLTKAVSRRVRGAASCGTLLSGGLDSASVALRATHCLDGGGALRTFSLVFDTVPESDERTEIESVLKVGAFEPHFLRGDLLDPFGRLDEMLGFLDEPPPGVNTFLHWAAFEAASQAGVRVILDGNGGDAVVGYGLERLIELLRSVRIPTLFAEGRSCARRLGLPPRTALSFLLLRPILKTVAARAPRIHRLWRAARGLPAPVRLSGIVRPELARELQLEERIRSMRPSGPSLSVGEERRRTLAFGTAPAVQGPLERAAAAFGLELRLPFFDRRLVELCLQMPSELSLRDGWTRWVHRAALRELPGEVRWRARKARLGPNFVRALRNAPTNPEAGGILSLGHGIHRFVDLDALRRTWSRFAREGGADDAFVLGLISSLSAWLVRNELAC